VGSKAITRITRAISAPIAISQPPRFFGLDSVIDLSPMHRSKKARYRLKEKEAL
jgi:hypothetical protein